MIDCEAEVFSRLATSLREDFPDINLSSEYVAAPSRFPHVSCVMSDNTVIYDQCTDTTEMAQAMFEINIYSNKNPGKKSECKDIVAKIDKTLTAMNFRRMSITPVPNMDDATIYRLVARYRVATDGRHFYRR